MYISTHSLTKRLTTKENSNTVTGGISTHSLTKRLTVLAIFGIQVIKYFNSQPHEEADVGKVKIPFFYGISTHSLTKRLTGLAAGEEKSN